MNLKQDKILCTTTMVDLRRVLWLEINDLRNGKSTPHRANALSKLAAQILDSTRLEIQNKWTRLLNAKDVEKLPKELEL